ncbi:alpha/beta hydrolase fold domain-containing protein [Microbacterium karelineae]|uniref:alpha/beta hydrolase fold domain-containing protein n=1 Tax=Microbacterium karelineae TaxID=2654283 RepID=UPI0012EA93A4|nr:alpha/beta hydrolase fold domain-containing protein [Microbacterium karelineae]
MRGGAAEGGDAAGGARTAGATESASATRAAKSVDAADAAQAAGAARPGTTSGATRASAADPTAKRDATADLRRLLSEIRASPAPALPRFERGPDESPDAWRERIAAARRDADAHALAHRELVDRASKRLFGTTAHELLPPVPEDLRRSEIHVKVAGRVDVDVSVTAPADPSGAVVVRLHGGGFWMGGGRAARLIDRDLVDQLTAGGATVLNVDYRLAPEHPFPASIDDVRGVLAAVRGGHIGGDLDPRRIALVGTSSGANIAAAVALAELGARDPLAGLALIVPSLRLDAAPAVMRDDPGAWDERQGQLRGYLGDAAPEDPLVSPALSPSLGSLPPVHAVVARHDEIADGGLELCAGVERAGGSAAVHLAEMTHTVAAPHVEAEWIRGVVGFVRRVVE